MTDQHQHRATPEQWALTESRGVGVYATSSCLIELRDRIQSLETHIAVMEPLVARTQAATGSALHLAAEISKLGHRVEALEAAQHAHAITGPADQLHSYKVGPAEPVDDWGKGFTQVRTPDPAAGAQVGRSSAAVDRVLALQDQIRDGSLTLAEALKKIGALEPAPSPRLSSLVDRVIHAINPSLTPIFRSDRDKARAAIREVAAWINERELKAQNDPDCLEASTADEAVGWLRNEIAAHA
jgi:hypothetical protein